MRSVPQTRVVPEFIAFDGGLDVTTPPLRIPPGFVRDAQNYECDVNGGYARCMGYERYDGRTAPSSATYSILTYDTLTGSVVVGNTVTDNATTSTAVVIAVASTYLVVTKVVGAWPAGNLKVGGSTVGTFTTGPIADSAATPLLDAQYRNLAADEYRDDIGAVTGEDGVLGVWVYEDNVYSFRNEAAPATGVKMYKATTSGWTAVTMYREVSFTAGSGFIEDGQTVTETTGGEASTIKRVVIETGDLASGTAAGRLIVTTPSGSEFEGGAATTSGGSGAGALTLSGPSAAITFPNQDGRFEFENYNFGQGLRMYGCDGVNRPFEFDGDVLVPITTGMESTSTPYPKHLKIHKEQLFLAFGPLAQHSSPTEPYVFNAITGAGQLNLGDDITGFVVQPGGANEGAMTFLGENQTATLYGSTVDDWNLVPYKNGAGAKHYSVQRVMDAIMLDDRGLNTLTMSQNYGNFADSTLSKRIQSWLATRRNLVRASLVARDKNQYRLFFSDGSALYATFDNGKLIGFMPQLLSHTPTCACAAELSDGTEVIFFGASDGYVYQMERGTSFDGGSIEARMHFVFAHSGAPNQLKSYRGGTFELTGDGYFEFSLSHELGYGSALIEQPGTTNYSESLTPAYWDVDTWDNFFFDGVSLTPTDVEIYGDGENVSIKISSSADYYASHRFTGIILRHIARRQLRTR